MNVGAYEQMKKVGYHLAKQYKLVHGDMYLQGPEPSVKQRTVALPPLLSDLTLNIPVEAVIRECYGAQRLHPSHFQAMWGYIVGLVKNGGWKPAEPFYEFVSLMFPDLQQPLRTPRHSEFDVRGLLCQALVIAHHRMPNTKVHVSKDLVALKIKDVERAAISKHAITWQGGHYIRMTHAAPIDFTPWSFRPMRGKRLMTVEAAALYLRLIQLMPNIANQVDIVFRCAAAQGDEACQALCEPYDIRITEETIDQASAVSAMLAAQRQLKAKR